MNKNWIINDLNFNDIEKNLNFLKINKLIISILNSRNINTLKDLNDFINPRLSMLHSPFIFDGMYDAVERIKNAISNDEKIGIFSDSDIDGLTSLTLLYKLFNKMSIDIYYRYPIDDESYGLTLNIIDEFIKNKINLLITVDSGIRDVEEIRYAKKNGIDVIITDHHEQNEQLPDAIIINPKKNNCTYPFKDLAGVGVAFKLCHAILLSYLPCYKKNFILITKENNYYAYAQIKNGIIENKKINASKNEIEEISGKLKKSDNILLYEVDELIDCFSQKKLNVHHISDFFKDSENLDLINHSKKEDLSKLLKINLNVYDNTIDFLIDVFLEIQFYSSKKINQFHNSILEFVAIGSIADVMPLVDENRILVYHGIKVLNNTEHKGLSTLINGSFVNSKFIGWDIAPILNSPGRFGQTDLTAKFFLENHNNTNTIINEIRSINNYRKNIVDKIFNEIIMLISDGDLVVDDDLFYYMSEDIPEGVAGLIASKLSNYINKPVIIASLLEKNGLIKGSGRCFGKFNFFEYILPYSDMFEKFGGHSQAFGFTAKLEKITDIINAIKTRLKNNYTYKNVTKIDLEINLTEISYSFIKELSILEPFGKGNETPVFLSKNVVIEKFQIMGAKKNHGKYSFKNGSSFFAIGWNMTKKMSKYYDKKQPIDIIYTLELNNFRGHETPQMILIDIDDNVKNEDANQSLQ